MLNFPTAMRSEVHNIDCLAYMKGLPDNCFQLAIADPPYGISAITNEPYKQAVTNPRGTKMRNRIKQGAGKLKDRAIQNLDSSFDFEPPTQEFFDELFRVSKNQIIWGGNYFPLPPTRCVLCWDKQQPWENFSQFELAWTSFDSPAALFRYRNTGGGRNTSIQHRKPWNSMPGFSTNTQNPATSSLILCSGAEVRGLRPTKSDLISSAARSTRSSTMQQRNASGANASEYQNCQTA